MKGSPGPSLTYSASSEDAASTSGPNQADEASSVEVWLWSHGTGHVAPVMWHRSCGTGHVALVQQALVPSTGHAAVIM